MRDGWDDDDEPDQVSATNVITPRYGGTPVQLSQMLSQAREKGDTEMEGTIHSLRKKLFRNRRTSEELTASQSKNRARWIERYGRVALDYDAEQKRLRSLTLDEQDVIIKAHEEPEPEPTKKTSKKGAK